MTTLVLGLGNPIVADDGIGIRLARDFEAELGARDGVTWRPECSVGGLNLLDLVVGFDRVILLDGIVTPGGRPGAWYRFTAEALRQTRYLSSIHDANFATVLELGRRLGLPVPRDDEIHIFAIEIVAHEEFGEGLSPELAAAYPRLREEIGEELARLFGG